MMLKHAIKKSLIATTLIAASTVAYAAEVEVLHYWTSGGEAKSVAELKKIMEAKGVTWKDFAVAGGAGENATTALKARVIAGSPPTAGSRGDRRTRWPFHLMTEALTPWPASSAQCFFLTRFRVTRKRAVSLSRAVISFSVSGTESRKTISPTSSCRRWQRSFRKIRRGSWPARRTATMMRSRSDRS